MLLLVPSAVAPAPVTISVMPHSNRGVFELEDQAKNRSMLQAVRKGDLPRVRAILEDDRDFLTKITPFGSWLHIAAGEGQKEVAQYLLAQGVDVNIRGGVAGGNPLHSAAHAGQKEMASFLLENGAKFDVTEPERNPLFAAIHDGHTDLVRLLVEAGIDTTVRYTGLTMKNMGALEFAKERGHAETIAYIEGVTKGA